MDGTALVWIEQGESMSSGRTVGPDEFRQALAAMMADVRVFTLEVDAVGPRHGSVPWDGSPAIRELADEPGYQERCSWTGPFTDTHMLGGLTLQAAADYVRTFAESFKTQSVPIYGHLVVARAALESSVVSWWLSEAAIARDERVKRGLSEFLYSASEVFRLKIRADGGEQVKGWTAYATELGWAATDYEGKPWKPGSRGTPRVDGVERPSIQKAITRLLVSNPDATIGKLLWSKLSAVSHVTYFGLESAMSVEDAVPTLAPGVKTVPVSTNSTSVSQQAFCVVRALRRAATARFVLMGWEDDAWKAARDFAENVELKLSHTYRAGQPAPTDEQAE
jgi:hypothetical protein